MPDPIDFDAARRRALAFRAGAGDQDAASLAIDSINVMIDDLEAKLAEVEEMRNRSARMLEANERGARSLDLLAREMVRRVSTARWWGFVGGTIWGVFLARMFL